MFVSGLKLPKEPRIISLLLACCVLISACNKGRFPAHAHGMLRSKKPARDWWIISTILYNENGEPHLAAGALLMHSWANDEDNFSYILTISDLKKNQFHSSSWFGREVIFSQLNKETVHFQIPHETYARASIKISSKKLKFCHKSDQDPTLCFKSKKSIAQFYALDFLTSSWTLSAPVKVTARSSLSEASLTGKAIAIKCNNGSAILNPAVTSRTLWLQSPRKKESYFLLETNSPKGSQLAIYQMTDSLQLLEPATITANANGHPQFKTDFQLAGPATSVHAGAVFPDQVHQDRKLPYWIGAISAIIDGDSSWMGYQYLAPTNTRR